MSTNSNCQFIQTEPEKWFYVLEHSHAPKNSWDWREHASCYGPFESEEKADEHLRDNHANPGGCEVCELPPGIEKLDLSKDEVLQRLINEAENPGARRGFRVR